MSFLYPRVCAISRSAVSVQPGTSAYGGLQSSAEASIASGVPCSIQQKVGGGRPDPALPSDAAKKSFWRIYIPLNALALGTINTDDIVTDDLGDRYGVIANYWNSLGYALLVEKFEV